MKIVRRKNKFESSLYFWSVLCTMHAFNNFFALLSVFFSPSFLLLAISRPFSPFLLLPAFLQKFFSFPMLPCPIIFPSIRAVFRLHIILRLLFGWHEYYCPYWKIISMTDQFHWLRPNKWKKWQVESTKQKSTSWMQQNARIGDDWKKSTSHTNLNGTALFLHVLNNVYECLLGWRQGILVNRWSSNDWCEANIDKNVSQTMQITNNANENKLFNNNWMKERGIKCLLPNKCNRLVKKR